MTWTPPDGLERSRPREVRLTTAGRAAAVLAVVLGLGALAAFAGLQAVVARDARHATRLAEEGRLTEAVVTGVRADKGKKKARVRVSYRFVAGGAVQGEARLPRAIATQLQLGSILPVRYLPRQPEINTPAMVGRRQLPAPIPFVVAGLLLFGGGAMGAKLRCARHLLASGRAAEGVVLSRRSTQNGTVVRFAFTTLAGRRQEGRVTTTRTLKTGDVVCVLYDPDEPARTALYPMALLELRERRALTRSNRTASRDAATRSA